MLKAVGVTLPMTRRPTTTRSLFIIRQSRRFAGSLPGLAGIHEIKQFLIRSSLFTSSSQALYQRTKGKTKS
jgi:hypothetical protein